jgi:type I restriction enzyme S subunit
MSKTWSLVPLGHVLKQAARFESRDILREYHFAGTYSFARGIFAGERKLGAEFKLDKIQRIKSGDFVYCKIMAWEGAFGVVPPEADNCVMSGAFVVYEVDSTQVEQKFLDYYFKLPHVWKSIGSGSTGTNVRRRSLHPTQFEEAKILLPPLPEQHRIIARIEELAAKIEEARGLRRQAVEEAEALIASRSTELFEDMGKLSGVAIRTLGENSSNPIQIGPFGAQLHRSEFVEDGVPVLNVGNVWPTGLRLENVDHVTPEKAMQLKRYTIQHDDLLFARSGATLGKVCVVPQSCDGWLMSGHLFRVRFDQERCGPRFAFMCLRDVHRIREQVFGQVRGATRPGFNTTLLGNVELPRLPLPEQHRIVTYLDGLQKKVDALKRLQVETSAELNALLPSVLDKAFKGEL